MCGGAGEPWEAKGRVKLGREAARGRMEWLWLATSGQRWQREAQQRWSVANSNPNGDVLMLMLTLRWRLRETP